MEGLAPPIQNIYDALILPESASEMLQRFVLRSHVWQTDEDKLPRRFRASLPIWRHKTEYGIHPKNQVRYLLTDLFRYSLTHRASTNPLLLRDRVLARDQPLTTSYTWRGGDKIHFFETRDHMLAGRRPLPLLSSENQVAETIGHTLDSIEPIAPTIDLKRTRIQPLERSFDGWLAENSSQQPLHHPHLFSINFPLPSFWSDFLEPEANQITQDEKNAAVVMHCFGQAMASAARLYGDEVVTKGGPLPAPVVTQAVCCDGVYFDFASFQLNTLDMKCDGGVKNQIWLDGGRKLFEKEIPVRSMLRNTRYRELDMDVYRRFLSLYLYGMMPSSPPS